MLTNENKNRLSYFNQKYSTLFISAYFILSALKGLTNMLGHELPLTIITDIGILLISIEYLSKRKYTITSFIILLTIFILSTTSIFNNYPIRALFSGIRWQLFYMLAFIVGMSQYFDKEKFFHTMLWTVFFVDLIGLYLYFMPPSWYMGFKLQGLDVDNMTNNMMLEMSRLSAFWAFPYWVSYGSAFCYYYTLDKYYKGKMKTKQAIFFILFFLIILLFAQQRLPLAFITFATLGLLFSSIISKDKNNRSFLKGILSILLSIIIISLIVLPIIVDSEIFNFGMKKLEEMFNSSDSNNESNFLTSRFGLFLDYVKIKSFFWGSGLGSYSFNSDAKTLVLDNMWLTIFLESGILGIALYCIIFLRILKRGYKKIRSNLFEIGIILMFLLAMFGANSLSKNTQHPIVLWLCCGHIFKCSFPFSKDKNQF